MVPEARGRSRRDVHGVAATCYHGISTSRPRRRRGPCAEYRRGESTRGELHRVLGREVPQHLREGVVLLAAPVVREVIRHGEVEALDGIRPDLAVERLAPLAEGVQRNDLCGHQKRSW